MSSIYVLEPRTRGRVVLKTSHGPVSVTLWTDEAPKAVRSFIVLALSGYYNGLCFHRVVPGLLVQTGDPTKTGTGGRAALKIAGEGRSIAREVHGRLKFRRRGIVALVADEAGQCGSQFFLTLDKADWLDGQHTIFGQVDGDTIFNLLNMANNGDVDGFDVPDAPILHSVEYVWSGLASLFARFLASLPTCSCKGHAIEARDTPYCKARHFYFYFLLAGQGPEVKKRRKDLLTRCACCVFPVLSCLLVTASHRA